MPCAPSSSFRQPAPLFSKLRSLVPEDLVSDLALDDLVQAATKPKLKTAKSILVNQGDQAPNLVILGCPATVKSTGLSGRPTLLGFLGRGDAIVESMSENQISGATYQSLDDLACYPTSLATEKWKSA